MSGTIRVIKSVADQPLGGRENDSISLKGLVAALPGIAFRREMTADREISYPWFSPSVEEILGFPPDDVPIDSDGCLLAIHRTDRAEHRRTVLESAARLTPCHETFRVVTANGQTRWLAGRSQPRLDRNGVVIWEGVLIDVTGHRRAEARFNILMEHAADAIFILDADGIMVEVSAAAERMFGYFAHELVGRRLGFLVTGTSRDGRLSLGEISAGEPQEVEGRRKDGTVFALELSAQAVTMDGRRMYVGIGRDITERRVCQVALRETEQRLQAVSSNVPGMVFQRILHDSGRLEYSFVSEACRDVLGVDPDELMADPHFFLRGLSEEERGKFYSALERSAETMEPLDEEMAVVLATGQRRWLRGQSRPTRRDNGDIVWDGLLLDVTERKSAEQRLSFLAYFDPLTRLPNRAAFRERFATQRETARQEHTLFAVLSLGVDRFGIINATMGHEVGDRVLVAVADLLQAAMGPGDLLARASGDRFLALISGFETRRDLVEAVDRIHCLNMASIAIGAEQIDISACIGVALYPRDGEDAETLIRQADSALQLAKAQGPGTVRFFTEGMNLRAAKTLSLQAKIRRGIERGEFIPYFQPQVDLRTGCMTGMEALVRWIDADQRIVSPQEFIPVAEETGLIDGICEAMLERCARQNKAWQDQGLSCIPVAVNISGRQFQYSRRLLGTLERVLSVSGLDPHYFEIELTESSAMSDADNAIAVVNRLTEMGVGCAIDDFGTGYSSLSVLKRFPIKKLKIDRSFVMDIITDPNDAAIVDAIIAMARALKLTTVAEGVEDPAHLDFLRRLGCDQMQGYLFSRPVDAEAMGRMLVEGKSLHLGPLG